MESKKKKFRSLSLLALFQILFGAAGSGLFITTLDWSSFKSFYLLETPIENVYSIGIDLDSFVLGLFYCLMTFPFVIILIAGVGIFWRKLWGRSLDIVFLPMIFLFVISFACIGYPYFEEIMNWNSFFMVIIPQFLFITFAVIYLFNNKVKDQFS